MLRAVLHRSSATCLPCCPPLRNTLFRTMTTHLDDASSKAQIDFMLKDEVILLDNDDNVIGHKSKLDTHLMENIDAGMLHRAFSVFLFNSKGEVLFTQRAGSKITFPLVWTNTCCSHPLYTEEELDNNDYNGVKRAAIRKMDQELGVPLDTFELKDFTFLTRMHYKAAWDEKWGEHEIDYILFCQKDITVNPNPDEVEAVKYFSKAELTDFVEKSDDPTSGIKVSPWFRKIFDNFLLKWWDHLDDLSSQIDADSIHRL